MTNETSLTLSLTKNYPNLKLEVDAVLHNGITAIFGPSGSGKTTVLDCVAGIRNPDKGEIILGGKPLFSSSCQVNVKPEKRRIGYMFQDGLLFPHQTVLDNMKYGFDMIEPERQKVRLEDLISLMELTPLLHRHTLNLSLGERQRVALARSLATSPELLLMDEPLASLDMGLRGKILRYLKVMHQELDIPIIYVSHSISEVLAIASKCLVIVGGKQLAFDEPRKVILEPFVHSVIDTRSLENLLDVTLTGQTEGGLTEVQLGTRMLWVPHIPQSMAIGDKISIAVRAADIIIAMDKPSRMSARNVIKANITLIQRIDTKVVIYADVGTPVVIEITSDALDTLGLLEGQEVFLVIKSSSIIVLN